MIAGENAQAAGINRQRFVQAELRREIGDEQLGLIAMLAGIPTLFGQVRLEGV
jgi:hypothetical protein